MDTKAFVDYPLLRAPIESKTKTGVNQYLAREKHFFLESEYNQFQYQQFQLNQERRLLDPAFGDLLHVSHSTNKIHVRRNKGADHGMFRHGDGDGDGDDFEALYEQELPKFNFMRNPCEDYPRQKEPYFPKGAPSWECPGADSEASPDSSNPPSDSPRSSPSTPKSSSNNTPPTSLSSPTTQYYTPTAHDEFAAAMARWPLLPNLPTAAPFMKSEAGWSRPRADQTSSALFGLMAIAELGEKIMGRLCADVEALSMLARTSQASFDLVEATFMHWDLTNLVFENCNLRPGAEGAIAADSIRATRFVKVSPVRAVLSPEAAAKKKVPSMGHKGKRACDKTCALGQCDIGVDLDKHDAAQSIDALYGMLLSVHLRGDAIRYLHLHRVRYLDPKGIEALLSGLPNLEVLGVYACELVHFGAVRPVIQKVAEYNTARERQGEDRLALDIFPRLHQGPVYRRYGDHAVVWEDQGKVHTGLGIAAHLVTLVPFAKKHGIDLLSPGKAFRLWLEKIPFKFGTLPHILEAVLNVLDFQKRGERAARAVHPPNTPAFAALYADMERTVHYDLLLAVRGAPESRDKLRKIAFKKCHGCRAWLLSAFWNADAVSCLGCNLLNYLGTEMDHRKQDKAAIAGRLFAGCGEEPTLDWLFDTEPGARGRRRCRARAAATPKSRREYMGQLVAASEALGESQRQREETDPGLPAMERAWRRRRHDELQATVTLLRTVLGAQREPRPQDQRALNWDVERRRYRYQLELDEGAVERGYDDYPHPGVNIGQIVW